MKRIEKRLISAFGAGLIILLAPIAVGAVELNSTPTMSQLTALIFILFIFEIKILFLWQKEDESDEDNH